MKKQIMLDLETLGTDPGCVVLSIGAVEFDVNTGLGESFYRVINIESCVEAGLAIDPDTVQWWKRQPETAQEVLHEARSGASSSLNVVLREFSRYCARVSNESTGLLVWGNGAGFDQPILAAAYRAMRMPVPLAFYDERCYRTLKNLRPDCKMPKRTGAHHNALDDAKSQALHAIELLYALRSEPIYGVEYP